MVQRRTETAGIATAAEREGHTEILSTRETINLGPAVAVWCAK